MSLCSRVTELYDLITLIYICSIVVIFNHDGYFPKREEFLYGRLDSAMKHYIIRAHNFVSRVKVNREIARS